MNVVILEDERLTAQRLAGMLQRYDTSVVMLATLASVEEAIEWFSAAPVLPDLVFMDIHLEDGISFRVIEQLQLTVPIIFTTAYDDYMIRAFKVNSIDYLLKPINYDELVASIEKFKMLRQQFAPQATPESNSTPLPDLSALLTLLGNPQKVTYKDRFMVTVGTRIRTVKTTEIAYFYLEDKMTFLVTEEGLNLPVDYSLDKLAQMLDPQEFFRTSRQFLVSLSAVGTVHVYSPGKLKLELEPRPRQEVFVSGDRIADFKDWLGK